MKICVSIILFLTFIACNRKFSSSSNKSSQRNYTLVWADEFNKDGRPDTANWNYEFGFVRNHEAQWYQPLNAKCENGLLVIQAKKEKVLNPNYVQGSDDWTKNRKEAEYTSACLITLGKHQWQYGRFELKARIDTVMGYWPAWWTLGLNKPWPQSGEIDIMEYFRGKLLANYYTAEAEEGKVRRYSKYKTVEQFDKAWKDSFHVWRMDWDEKGISIFLDDVLMNHQKMKKLYNRDGSGYYPFKQSHYMLLNLAIGGDSGGDRSNAKFPLKFEIDYVRVYQDSGKYSHQPIKLID